MLRLRLIQKLFEFYILKIEALIREEKDTGPSGITHQQERLLLNDLGPHD